MQIQIQRQSILLLLLWTLLTSS